MRARTTIAAALIVGIALLVASIGLVWFVEASLTSQIRSVAQARAREIARGAEPTGGDPEEEFVQVLDEGGRVEVASANVEGSDALARVPAGGEVRIRSIPEAEGPFLAVAAEAPGGRTVLVGRSLDDVGEARGAVIAGLVLGVPLLVALVGVVTWTIVGRALRPVDRMRVEAERISSDALDRRLPDPGTDDEIERLATTLNRMLDRLERSQVRQRGFVADASHELRSPIAVIRQHAEVARAHPERVDAGRLADVVLEEEARLERLIDDLLLLTRLDEGALALDERVALDDLAREEAARLRAIGASDVDTGRVGDGTVTGSVSQLERVLRNLGDNAARHARRTIALGVTERDGHVVLTVDDDGPGIAGADRERAFERFVRLDEGRAREEGGAGLGLAIVREIVVAHGGEVAMFDSPLGGLRVEVRLPAAP